MKSLTAGLDPQPRLAAEWPWLYHHAVGLVVHGHQHGETEARPQLPLPPFLLREFRSNQFHSTSCSCIGRSTGLRNSRHMCGVIPTSFFLDDHWRRFVSNVATS